MSKLHYKNIKQKYTDPNDELWINAFPWTEDSPCVPVLSSEESSTKREKWDWISSSVILAITGLSDNSQLPAVQQELHGTVDRIGVLTPDSDSPFFGKRSLTPTDRSTVTGVTITSRTILQQILGINWVPQEMSQQ